MKFKEAIRDFLNGMSRVFDMFSYLREYSMPLVYAPQKIASKKDEISLSQDWQTVGRDIALAMRDFKRKG